MTESLVWDRDGRDWPNRDASRFVDAGGLRWHVQQMGQGPAMLLIHGTGASTHSWRDLAPLLAKRFTVLMVDLPGHAFTQMPATASRLSLPGMASALGGLVQSTGLDIRCVVGHSAGAAIAARMVLDRGVAPANLIGLNAALLPLGGLAGVVFPPVARFMSSTSLAARLFAWRASSRAAVERLIEGTGSVLDQTGIELYARLVRDVKHVSAALGMMAHWDLEPLRLSTLDTPMTLLAADRDRAVPPSHAREAVRQLRGGTVTVMQGVGHLAHEERPSEIAGWITEIAGRIS